MQAAIEMVMVQRIHRDSPYVPKDHEVIFMAPQELTRMPGMITVECEVGGRRFCEQCVGYKERNGGIVMVTCQQMETMFS